MRTGLGLGSNLGDRLANLRRAREQIFAMPEVLPGALSAPIFETDPIDCAADAGAFLNTVVEIHLADGSGPTRLLEDLRGIERRLGRPSRYPRNASRVIDLDILYAGEKSLVSSVLTLPHPRLHLRRFVLAPLAAIRPDLVLPGQTETVTQLLRDLDDAARVRLVHSVW